MQKAAWGPVMGVGGDGGVAAVYRLAHGRPTGAIKLSHAQRAAFSGKRKLEGAV
ncbi:MAG: hypothetical protein IPJ94_27735 [Chloroflexi bacterium]|nr:hypothetical protein [Chloroflexota bacterium]